MTEQWLKRINDSIEHTKEGKEAALVLIKQAIPCIMHLENLCGEKLITVCIPRWICSENTASCSM
jgi:hypothetical protein